jgi:UDP-N-acetylmuramoyl-tripeptide--D-alanyl-D-alanine ligase
VVTNVGLAHVGEVGSLDAIARAKAELVTALPDTGFAILNNDDDLVRAMRFDSAAHVITYGEREGSIVRAENVSNTVSGTSTFDLVHGSDRHVIHLPLMGRHNVSNALAAAAVGIAVGMDLRLIAEALERVVTKSKWRMQVSRLSHGVTLINDAYNANPDSMAAALRTLADFPATRWAVLGGMRELGDLATSQHRAIGELTVELGIDHVICVGESARDIAAGAKSGRHTLWLPDFAAACNYIVAKVAPDDVLLLKASRSEGLEQLAQMIAEQLGEGRS